MELYSALITFSGTLLGVVLGAYLTRSASVEQARRDERRTAYVHVVEQAMLWAESEDSASSFAFISALYAARIIVAKDDPAYAPLTALHKLILSPTQDRAAIGEQIKAFYKAAHEELSQKSRRQQFYDYCKGIHHHRKIDSCKDEPEDFFDFKLFM